MISLTFTIDSINTILQVFDRIQILKYNGITVPTSPISLIEYSTLSGVDSISNISDISEIRLLSQYSQYYFIDPDGNADDWYISRYYSSINGSSSGWVGPILGEPGDLFYSPYYPPEVEYGTGDQRTINRIRLLIGDPININREYGEEAESSIHPDGRTYELDEKGWPAFVNMNGTQYIETSNPTVNGYKFLRFADYIDDPITVYSGGRQIQQGVDIWYYTFRWSDREIMDAYNNTPPPPPLNTTNANSEVYMLACAYDLLMSETWEAISEDGAKIVDDVTSYDPTPGLKTRADMLAGLRKRLDDAIKSLRLIGITGVLID